MLNHISVHVELGEALPDWASASAERLMSGRGAAAASRGGRIKRSSSGRRLD